MAPKNAVVKKDVKSKMAAKNGCDSRLKAKILITTIQVNLCCLLHVSLWFGAKFPWIVVVKIFALAYHHSYFLATTLDFTSFFTTAFLGAAHFLQLGCFWIRFHFFLLSSWQITCLLLFVLFFIGSVSVRTFDIIMYLACILLYYIYINFLHKISC